MPTVPKFTTPQAKMIRTLEGLLVVAFNLAMIVVPIVSNALPVKTAAALAAGVNTAAVIARSLAKGIMAWQTPLMPPALHLIGGTAANAAGTSDGPAEGIVSPDPQTVFGEIQLAHEQAQAVQSQPGTPADQLQAGLSPDPAPTAAGPSAAGTGVSA